MKIAPHLFKGFHRPLRVVPPSATPSNGANSRSHHGTTPTSSSRQNHQPTTPPHHRHHQHHHQHQHPGGGGGGNAGGQMPPHPPPYTIRTSYFPSHFFPEKMHQYWQYYYPRIPGTEPLEWSPVLNKYSYFVIKINDLKLFLQGFIRGKIWRTSTRPSMNKIEQNPPILMCTFTRPITIIIRASFIEVINVQQCY